jgi:hypothetical protein
MQAKRLLKNKWIIGVIVLISYLSSYELLWDSREETMFVMTIDRGCIGKSMEIPVIRYACIDNSPLRPVVSFVYWPLNYSLYFRN